MREKYGESIFKPKFNDSVLEGKILVPITGHPGYSNFDKQDVKRLIGLRKDLIKEVYDVGLARHLMLKDVESINKGRWYKEEKYEDLEPAKKKFKKKQNTVPEYVPSSGSSGSSSSSWES